VVEGCNEFCTFCVVPYTRGRELSRPMEDVLREVRALAASGLKEVELLGQTINSYRCPQTGADFAALLEAVGRRRGLLERGGGIDRDRAADVVLRELQRGQIGRISFEGPEDRPQGDD